jgi:pimeloyl-ACP methyl ester carboxylesterase
MTMILVAVCTAAAIAGWIAWVLARNRRLTPPPITGPDGRSLPTRLVEYTDGAVVSCVDVGRGMTVLFIPGADGIKETFRFQVPAVAVYRRAVCADLRARFEEGATFDRFVDDVHELIEQLDLGSVTLVGQSLGGSIAMRFAARYPERVTGLVVANSLARITYEHVGLNRTALTPLAMLTTRYLPTWLARWFAAVWSRLEVWVFDHSPGSDRVVEYVLWTGPRTVPASISQARVDLMKPIDLRPEIRDISVDTLVIKGPCDHYTPPAWSEEIAELIPGARYVTIPETGHCSHVAMPGSFNRVLIDWLHRFDESSGGAE